MSGIYCDGVRCQASGEAGLLPQKNDVLVQVSQSNKDSIRPPSKRHSVSLGRSGSTQIYHHPPAAMPGFSMSLSC